MMAVLVWVAWLLLCGLSWSQVEGTEPTPIVLWHGMGDCCCNPLRNIIIHFFSSRIRVRLKDCHGSESTISCMDPEKNQLDPTGSGSGLIDAVSKCVL